MNTLENLLAAKNIYVFKMINSKCSDIANNTVKENKEEIKILEKKKDKLIAENKELDDAYKNNEDRNSKTLKEHYKKANKKIVLAVLRFIFVSTLSMAIIYAIASGIMFLFARTSPNDARTGGGFGTDYEFTFMNFFVYSYKYAAGTLKTGNIFYVIVIIVGAFFILFILVEGLKRIKNAKEEKANLPELLVTYSEVDYNKKLNNILNKENEIDERIYTLNNKNESLLNFKSNCNKNVQVTNNIYNGVLQYSNIYRSYWNIEAICQFIQYLESGRCTELQGPHGCYNLYEEEIKAGRIINQLDIIINQLDTLNKTMYRMTETLKEINNGINAVSYELNRINSKLDDIAIAAQISSYCNELNLALQTQNSQNIAELTHSMSTIEYNSDYLRRYS